MFAQSSGLSPNLSKLTPNWHQLKDLVFKNDWILIRNQKIALVVHHPIEHIDEVHDNSIFIKEQVSKVFSCNHIPA